MTLRTCSHSSCSHPAERSFGSCMICSSHLCAEHSVFPFHVCPSEEEDADAYYSAYDSAKEQLLLSLLRQVDVQALTTLASSLRMGVPCEIPALRSEAGGEFNFELISSQMGGQNCHIDIEFEDGVVWLARVRLDDPLLPPKPIRTYITRSEVATMKFLEHTKVPAPRIFYHGTESTDDIGVGFILLEKLQGKPLDWNNASSSQRTKVMEQLVDIYLELAKYPFNAHGSLIATDAGRSTVGAFAQVSLFESSETPSGPFKELDSSLPAIIRLQMKLIESGELSALAVDNYLSHCWRLESLSEVVHSPNNDGQFYLKHFEDKGDHILIDADYNITGMIDWEFASTEPKALAFSSPCMLWPVGDFYNGHNHLTPEEIEFAGMFEQHEHKDIAEAIRGGRVTQRFTFFNGGGDSTEQEEFEALFQGLRGAIMGSSKEQLTPYASWRAEAMKNYAADAGLNRIWQRRSSGRSAQP